MSSDIASHISGSARRRRGSSVLWLEEAALFATPSHRGAVHGSLPDRTGLESALRQRRASHAAQSPGQFCRVSLPSQMKSPQTGVQAPQSLGHNRQLSRKVLQTLSPQRGAAESQERPG